MKNNPLIISGKALVGEDLYCTPVDIIIESGIITAIEENPKARDIGSALHSLMPIPTLGIQLRWTAGPGILFPVTPPDGLKHHCWPQLPVRSGAPG